MALANRIIVIDAGHGGKFDGVTFDHWLYGPIKEKDVNLRVAKKLKEKLLAENVVVKMTREGDTDFGGIDINDDINKRVQYINNNFLWYSGLISLHVNTPTGNIGSFYQLGKTDSMVFAETISEELGTSTYVGDFAILRDTTVNSPKTLIETARINAASIHLPSFEENIATSIVSGLKKYFA